MSTDQPQIIEYSNWFLDNNIDKLFDKHLSVFKGKDIKALQVGVFSGDASKWLLENILTHPDSTLTDVDCWQNEDGISDVGPTFFGDEAYERYLGRISGFENKVRIRKMTSGSFFKQNTNTFDLIYVDADHRAISVLEDAVDAFRVLNPGGIMIFDDYDLHVDSFPIHEIPRISIDAFLFIYSRRIKVIGREDNQIYIRKI